MMVDICLFHFHLGN